MRDQSPKRRWFRFSLRTLFALVALLCVWMASEVNRVWNMRRAIAVIERHNGTFIYHHQRPDGIRGEVDKSADVPAPAWLRHMIGDDFFRSISRVTLRGKLPINSASGTVRNAATRLSDEEWKLIGSLTSLEELSIQELAISDTAFLHLRHLTNLKSLKLLSTGQTDASLKTIARLQKLEQLWIASQELVPLAEQGTRAQIPITDQGLALLKDLTNLEELDLSGAQVTDAGLVHLQGMKKLRTLGLGSTNVTDDVIPLILSLPIDGVNLSGSRVSNEKARHVYKVMAQRGPPKAKARIALPPNQAAVAP